CNGSQIDKTGIEYSKVVEVDLSEIERHLHSLTLYELFKIVYVVELDTMLLRKRSDDGVAKRANVSENVEVITNEHPERTLTDRLRHLNSCLSHNSKIVIE